MSKLKTWIVVFLAVAIVTLLISYAVLSARFTFPEYIPINCYAA